MDCGGDVLVVVSILVVTGLTCCKLFDVCDIPSVACCVCLLFLVEVGLGNPPGWKTQYLVPLYVVERADLSLRWRKRVNLRPDVMMSVTVNCWWW